MFVDLRDAPEREMAPGFHAKFVHTSGLTVAHWRVEAGSTLPLHDHPHEMIVNVIEGDLEVTVAEETKLLGPGDVAVIPGGVAHGVTARTECRLIDVWHPPRDDYR